jgi:hypothetical protein
MFPAELWNIEIFDPEDRFRYALQRHGELHLCSKRSNLFINRRAVVECWLLCCHCLKLL